MSVQHSLTLDRTAPANPARPDVTAQVLPVRNRMSQTNHKQCDVTAGISVSLANTARCDITPGFMSQAIPARDTSDSDGPSTRPIRVHPSTLPPVRPSCVSSSSTRSHLLRSRSPSPEPVTDSLLAPPVPSRPAFSADQSGENFRANSGPNSPNSSSRSTILNSSGSSTISEPQAFIPSVSRLSHPSNPNPQVPSFDTPSSRPRKWVSNPHQPTVTMDFRAISCSLNPFDDSKLYKVKSDPLVPFSAPPTVSMPTPLKGETSASKATKPPQFIQIRVPTPKSRKQPRLDPEPSTPTLSSPPEESQKPSPTF